MRALARLFSTLILFILVLAGGGFYWLTHEFNPNDYKDKITSEVEKKLGRELQINGDMTWSFLPQLGLQLPEMRLSEPGTFKQGTAVQWHHANVAIELWPLLQKQLVIKEINLKDVHLGASPQALDVGLKGRVHLLDNIVQVPALTLDVDSAQGNLKLTGAAFLNSTTQELQLEKVTLTVPSFQQGTGASVFSLKNMKWEGSGVLHLDALKTASTVDGSGEVAHVNASGFIVNKVNFKTRFKNGIVTLSPITADLYQGTYQGRLALDLKTEPLHWQAQQTISHVQLAPLFKDVAPQVKLQGTADIKSSLEARGLDKVHALSSLAGNVDFAVTKGVWDGLDILYYWQMGTALANHQPTPTQKGTSSTVFDKLQASFQIQKGIARNNDLLLQSNMLNVTGQGQIDLSRSSLDYRLFVTSPRSKDSLKIPLNVTGTFDAIHVAPDVGALVKQVANKEVDRLKKQAVDKMKAKFGSDMGGAIGEQLDKLNVGALFN